jgi:hypothetical protein
MSKSVAKLAVDQTDLLLILKFFIRILTNLFFYPNPNQPNCNLNITNVYRDDSDKMYYYENNMYYCANYEYHKFNLYGGYCIHCLSNHISDL